MQETLSWGVASRIKWKFATVLAEIPDDNIVGNNWFVCVYDICVVCV